MQKVDRMRTEEGGATSGLIDLFPSGNARLQHAGSATAQSLLIRLPQLVDNRTSLRSRTDRTPAVDTHGFLSHYLLEAINSV
jgi:hypothetical protein